MLIYTIGSTSRQSEQENTEQDIGYITRKVREKAKQDTDKCKDRVCTVPLAATGPSYLRRPLKDSQPLHRSRSYELRILGY